MQDLQDVLGNEASIVALTGFSDEAKFLKDMIAWPLLGVTTTANQPTHTHAGS